MTKKLISVSLAAISAFTMTASAFAAAPETTVPVSRQEAVAISAAAGVTRAYEYEWRLKSINGQAHKRLWNITLARWESEWIPM